MRKTSDLYRATHILQRIVVWFALHKEHGSHKRRDGFADKLTVVQGGLGILGANNIVRANSIQGHAAGIIPAALARAGVYALAVAGIITIDERFTQIDGIRRIFCVLAGGRSKSICRIDTGRRSKQWIRDINIGRGGRCGGLKNRGCFRQRYRGCSSFWQRHHRRCSGL